ncbi:MAG: UDP-N-acetylmuramoyl-L-alanyl-D-glutamate--2,6-diaminopimelate ligase [Candidatus Acidiferrales bacterium]
MNAPGMKLRDVLAGAEILQLAGSAEALISSIAYNSRKVAPGALFFALRGEKSDGNQFVSQAIERGAIAIASENPAPADLPTEISWVRAAHARRALAISAANFFGHPADHLEMAAITGTNGKTTTAYLIDSIFCAAGKTTGLLGTISYRTPKGVHSAPNTTPESLDFQQILAEIAEAGGTHVALEASSHALAMDRLWGCRFGAAVFTNLTREHMDYHKDFENYFSAKRLLFEGTGAGRPKCGVVNIDDPYGKRLCGLAKETLTYGLEAGAQVTAKKFALAFSGLEFTAQTPAGKIAVHSPLVGRINVYNILAAIGAALALGIEKQAIEAGIANLKNVPGRFERIDEGQPFLVIVDYAHTDDALQNLLATARELSPSGRIIIVFGAGGERDRTKRPLMGEAAGRGADLVVLTSDNPRSEDPLRIINDVVVGLQKVNAKYRIEPDRERAIPLAFEEARPGDMVLLAGKGHETYQILRDVTLDFDDRDMARRFLRERGYSKPAESA